MTNVPGVNVEKVFRQRENVFGRLRNWPKLRVDHLPYILPDLGKIIIDYCQPCEWVTSTLEEGDQLFMSVDGKRYFCTLPNPTKLHCLEVFPKKINGIAYNKRMIIVNKTQDSVAIKYTNTVDNSISYGIVYWGGREVWREISNGAVSMRYRDGVYVGMTPLP